MYFFCQAFVAQEGRKEFDFIVSIDRELPKTLYNPRIIVKDDNLNRKVINVSYIIQEGCLSVMATLTVYCRWTKE